MLLCNYNFSNLKLLIEIIKLLIFFVLNKFIKISFKSNIKAFSLIELSIVILIIGILVAGVTQSSRLFRQITLSTA